MEIGIGIDGSLGLSFVEQRTLVQEATRLGYTSAWTPSGGATRDGFQVCAFWNQSTTEIVSGGIQTGIAVIPVGVWTVPSLVNQAGTVCDLSGGRFILGIGTGGIYSEEYRQGYGLPPYPAVGMMRDYLVTLRDLFAGKKVTHDGPAVKLRGIQVTGKPLPVPIYLAALGPQMLRLAGEAADGVSLNWATPAQRVWCRDRIAEGAKKAGREAASVHMMEYIRVCVDDDVDVARRAFAQALMGYALGRAGASNEAGYRGHFGRMGFDSILTELERRRDAGASAAEIADGFPPEMMLQIGYYGKPEGAAEGFRRVAEGLDTAIVRIVGARPGLAAARAVMNACAGSLAVGAR